MRHFLSTRMFVTIAGLTLSLLASCTPKSGEQQGEVRDSGLDSLTVPSTSSSQELRDAETPKQYHTGLFIVDSLSLFDSLQSAATGDSSTPRFSSAMGDSLQAKMGAEKTDKRVDFDTNQCVGAILAGGRFADGAQAEFSDSVPYKMLFEGKSLSRLGLSAQSTKADVKKRFGAPAASGEGYEVFLSDQPDEEQGHYYDARWRVLVSYETGKVRRIVWFFYFEDC